MKHSILIGLAISFMLTACSRSDSKLSKQVVGSWTFAGGQATTIASDGSWMLKTSPSNSLAGTWHISDGVLIYAVTNDTTNEKHPQVGLVERCKITYADSHQLIYELDGKTYTLTR